MVKGEHHIIGPRGREDHLLDEPRGRASRRLAGTA